MSVHNESDYERKSWENDDIASYLGKYFPSEHEVGDLSSSEESRIQNIIESVHQEFGRAKYTLGMAINFVLLAQRIAPDRSTFEPSRDDEDIFQKYDRKEKKADGSDLNTLTLIDDGEEIGIRKTEEEVQALFRRNLNRLTYTTAYVYNTGQWQKYRELLADCFWLSEAGRYVAVEELIDYGLKHMDPSDEYEGNPRTRLFPLVVKDYLRGQVQGENAGLVFQAIAYGYFKADRPHLSLEVSKVRMGSERQQRVGDVEGYTDVKVELSVEVKDFELTEGQIAHELGSFIQQVTEKEILGIVFVRGIDNSARRELEDEGVKVFTQADLLESVSLWDWQKQDRALRGVFHYLSHIEENTDAVKRLQQFVHEHDEDHDVLLGFNPESEGTSDPQQELELE